MKIKCPICNEELVRIDNLYRCLNRHSYDIAKEGYINLLKKQGGKEFGDSVDMIKARRQFFLKDYYRPLKEKLTSLINKYNPETLVDLGSGEGYYTNYFKDNSNADIMGIDISKEGVRIASKQNRNVTYVVGSVQDIPLFDKEVDMVINSFTPIDLEEILRVLKRKGILITTKVGKNHLLELKQSIYENIYLNDNKPIEDNRLKLLESINVKFPIHLKTNEDIVNLFMMTPYYHHTSLASKEKLKEIDNLDISCEFDIDVYQKNLF